jgi:mannosyltransferase OCH1-like enzyme
MIAKISSPLNLGSPTLAATTAGLRNRLPAQMRRSIPFYVACVVLVLFTLNLTFRSSAHTLVRPHFTPKDVPPASRPRVDFPRKIWQSWMVNPFAFEEKNAKVARTWPDMNKDWRYEVLTDGNAMQYVEFHFGPEGFDRPDIVDFYRDVRAQIVKADLLRYMIMYAEGGLYADIDVEALKPMTKFIPPSHRVEDIDMVIGVEIDEPDWRDHPILGPKSRSFCQWTFMCKPQLPVMMRLIEHIMTWLTEVAKEQNKPISEVDLNFDQIISGTGPSAFTEAIMKEMNILAQKNNQKKVEWDDFHDLIESKVVSRVLVLTVEAFAAGQGHSDSGNHASKPALVKHHYHASNWPSRHPRYSHPAYGEVEQCNWRDECVKKWDSDVAAFNKMSPEEQAKVVEEKTAERREKEEKEKEEKRKKDEERREKEEAKRKEEEEKLKQKWREEEEEAARKALLGESPSKDEDGKPPAEEPKKEKRMESPS